MSAAAGDIEDCLTRWPAFEARNGEISAAHLRPPVTHRGHSSCDRIRSLANGELALNRRCPVPRWTIAGTLRP